MRKKESGAKVTFAGLARLAELLNIDRQQLRTMMALHAAKTGVCVGGY